MKKMRLAKANFNFFTDFEKVPVDTEISPLVLACALGRVEIVKFLLAAPDIDLHLATEDGELPL